MLSKRSTPQQPRPASTARRKDPEDQAAKAARMADEIAGNLERWRRLERKELEGEAASAKDPSKERRWKSWEALVSCFPTEGYSFLKDWLFWHGPKVGESIVNQREAIHARDECLRPGYDAGADPETNSVIFWMMLADLGFHVDDLIRTLRHTAAMIREEALAKASAPPRPESDIGPQAPAPGGMPGRMNKQACALAVKTEHPDWNDAQVAEAAGCHVKSLSRMKLYRAAKGVLEQDKADFPLGRKPKDEPIEAWEEDKDDGESR